MTVLPAIKHRELGQSSTHKLDYKQSDQFQTLNKHQALNKKYVNAAMQGQI